MTVVKKAVANDMQSATTCHVLTKKIHHGMGPAQRGGAFAPYKHFCRRQKSWRRRNSLPPSMKIIYGYQIKRHDSRRVFLFGAADGSRTHLCSLGSCRSTDELRPHSVAIIADLSPFCKGKNVERPRANPQGSLRRGPPHSSPGQAAANRKETGTQGFPPISSIPVLLPEEKPQGR